MNTINLFAVLAMAMLMNYTPLYASDTDSRIESSAANTYIFKTTLKNDSIKVDSRDGVVSLTGTVANASDKSLAENTVTSLPGVKSVNNQLVVNGEQPAEHSDAWIGWKVKTALLFHRNVSATGTDVDVKDGIVTLTGEASSMAQKELTSEYAKDVDNVKSVVNDMKVAKALTAAVNIEASTGDTIDDASITAEVRSSLQACHSTCAMQTAVTTMDGVVTLSGVAKNEAEKCLATKLSTDIDGVSKVTNNMVVTVTVVRTGARFVYYKDDEKEARFSTAKKSRTLGEKGDIVMTGEP